MKLLRCKFEITFTKRKFFYYYFLVKSQKHDMQFLDILLVDDEIGVG